MIFILLLLLYPSNAVLSNDLIRVYDHSIPFFNVILMVWTITLLFVSFFFIDLFIYLFLNLGEVYKKLQKMEENHKNTWEEKER